MKMNQITGTSLVVSELCFATAHMGSLRAKISEEEGTKLLLSGLEQGINFIDTTAQMYHPYTIIKNALDCYHEEVILSVRSSTSDYKEMKKSLEKALESLDREVIDIFSLHVNRGTDEFDREKYGAIEALLEAKQKGWIRAIGVSAHSVKVLNRAIKLEYFDLINPAVNKLGLGLLDGNLEDMLQVIQKAHQAGKGILAMKTLAGGRLSKCYKEECIEFARGIPGINAIALGISKESELAENLRVFNEDENRSNFKTEIPDEQPVRMLESPLYRQQQEDTASLLDSPHRTLKRFSNFCIGCGICVNNCTTYALTLEKGKAQVDEEKCIGCGYCVSVCPKFALRLD
jgi:aryl-alcohol dehydrogenase-like predicted oxidoreductase/NAD-dependent dihydropyrimidine dehydrogenase PreA subunit